MPISGQTVLGMAAATGELHLYVLSENEVKHFRVHDFWKRVFLPTDFFVYKI